MTAEIKILLVCTGNTCRSAMAEGLLGRILAERGYDHVAVSSTGVAAYDGVAASPGAQAVMAELGLDLSHHSSRALTWEAVVEADWILVMESVHRRLILAQVPAAAYKCHLLGEYADADTVVEIPDPFGQPAEVFARCAEQLAAFLLAFVEKELVSGSRPLLAVGCDHRGLEVKQALLQTAESLGWRVLDCGVDCADPADYPDLAWEVARLVSRGRVSRGVLACSTGIGMDITANKVPGIRAALCHNREAAEISRRHNDANILVLGASSLSAGDADEILRAWMNTSFSGDRHARRLAKLARYEAHIKSCANDARSRP